MLHLYLFIYLPFYKITPGNTPNRNKNIKPKPYNVATVNLITLQPLNIVVLNPTKW